MSNKTMKNNQLVVRLARTQPLHMGILGCVLAAAAQGSNLTCDPLWLTENF